MPTLYNADLKPLAPGVSTHPYDHATKLFLADNYRLTPKQSFLYYVCINIDKTAYQAFQSGGIGAAVNSIVGDGGVSSQSLIEQYEAGLMAKRVDLPKFTLNTKTMNAYNRKNIVQTHLSYDPITVSFHDDAADVVTKFWNDYYTYYYRDSDYTTTEYQLRHKYNPRTRASWGYTPRNAGTTPFLRNIQIFSLHNKRFTEYLLVNPFITNWRHGEHNSYSSTELMENTMTVAYETVKYRTGYVNAVDVNGFGILHYDNVDSPISTSITNIYTDGGIISAVTGGATDLARPDGKDNTGLFNQIAGAARFYNNLKNVNFQSVAGTVLGQIGGQVLSGAANGAASVFFPTAGGQPGYGGIYSSSQTNGGGFVGSYPFATSPFSPLVTAGNELIGAVSRTAGQATREIGSIFGVQQNVTGRGIQIDPTTGQPVTGTWNAVVVDDNGNIVSRFSTAEANGGKYDAANPSVNLVALQTTVDENNNTVSVRTYADGTQIVTDATGTQIAEVKGNPIATSAGTSSGLIYTDPRTGVSYTTGTSTPALITNTITGTAGAAAGLVAGSAINDVLSRALGTSVIGRIISTAASGAVGTLVGRAVNNTLQPIVNQFTGQVTQVFDQATGQIKNVLTSYTSDPSKSVVNVVDLGEGFTLTRYANGSTVTRNANGETIESTPGSSYWSSIFNNQTGATNPTVGIDPSGIAVSNPYDSIYGANAGDLSGWDYQAPSIDAPTIIDAPQSVPNVDLTGDQNWFSY